MSKEKVTVIGLTGQSAFFRTEQLPKPGETVACKDLFFEAGGKGHNQAVACARMGIETILISAVGKDENGRACRDALKQEGVKTCLIEKDISTAFATVTTAKDGENVVEVFSGAAGNMSGGDLLQPCILRALQDCSYLLLQNELPVECLETAITLAEQKEVKVILNPAPARNLPLEFLSRCYAITPNAGEAKILAGITGNDPITDEEWKIFVQNNGIKNLIITMGANGVLIVNDRICKKIEAYSAGQVVDTTGAGDIFNGVMTAALASGEGLERAVIAAVTAAGISVTRKGVAGSIPQKEEVIGLMI